MRMRLLNPFDRCANFIIFSFGLIEVTSPQHIRYTYLIKLKKTAHFARCPIIVSDLDKTLRSPIVQMNCIVAVENYIHILEYIIL